MTDSEITHAHLPEEATLSADDDLMNLPFIILAFDGEVGKVA